MEESNRLDLISGLPPDILKKISSFLPLQEAVRTSVLSPLWSTLWSPVRLDFPAPSDVASESSLRAVADFLRSYGCPDIWKLRFGGSGTIVAAKGSQKELHLEFSLGGDEAEWKTNYYGLKMEKTPPAPGLAQIGTLETLHLGSLSSLGEIFASSLLANCENLRNLKLERCRRLKSLEIDEQNHSLERLIIQGCPDLERVVVSAPRLQFFSYRGKLPTIRLANTSSLMEVVLDLEGSQGGAVNFDCEEILSLLASIKDVEVMTVSGWLLEWLCSAGVIYKSLEFQFGRLKELRWIDDAMTRTKRDSLTCFLNVCPLLQSIIVTVDKNRAHVAPPLFHQHWHEPHLWRDYASVKADVHEQKHLKSVKILGITVDNEDVLSLVELLHEKAVVLESMTITSTERKSWRVVKVAEAPRSWQTRWKSWRWGGAMSQFKSPLELVDRNRQSLLLTSLKNELDFMA